MSQCHYIKYDNLGEKNGYIYSKKKNMKKGAHGETSEQLIKLRHEKG